MTDGFLVFSAGLKIVENPLVVAVLFLDVLH